MIILRTADKKQIQDLLSEYQGKGYVRCWSLTEPDFSGAENYVQIDHGFALLAICSKEIADKNGWSDYVKK